MKVIPLSKIKPVPMQGTFYPRPFSEEPARQGRFNQAEFARRQEEAARRYVESLGEVYQAPPTGQY